MVTRLDPKDRKKQILNAALIVAGAKGFNRMTREEIALQAGISDGLINRHFSTMAQLRRSVMRAAIANWFLPVVAQGLVLKDPQAMKAPDDLKNAALKSLAA
jgi:AcrR family transcriptional regulator